ncbi:cytochrome P450 [Alteriqipengyuania flavescens]|uniref:cytochrome P450 n=1 Tax=Alteriqipengyuania flavescens TaxID=3053610 RepID=UPI0025B4A32E|nr:cytochrome P450 [Alteriqipengyuania flavescens]WJY19720.1 cytochrome P450 [Alteriqipengyuania flavescens]WJY25660.1 cytochrome P450 [Alteriqipengyuania flavescens]
MATQAPPQAPMKFRSSPTAVEVLDAHLAANPDQVWTHEDPKDVSRSDIYYEDRWQPIFREMREEGPLHYVERSPFGSYWNVVQHKAIQHVESLPELYSSSWEYGGITILNRLDDEQLAKQGRERFELPMFIAMDRPKHTGQRRTVAPAFTPAEMKRMESEIRARTGELLDTLPEGEEFDWVDTVSIELTTGMLAILFGFPWEDRRLLTFWSDWAGDTEIALVRDLDEMRQGILLEMGAYFQQLWARRSQEEPGPDLISMMIHSEAMAEMDPQEFMGNLVLLIVGGNDTTRNTMSGIVHAFDQFPDQRELFEQNPDLIPNAVQECIRYQTPLAHMRRTATEDAQLFGEQIKKGDKLVMWYLSANRDEEMFENPDKLDITRENARRHIAFGYGIHRCVGARLAELQLRVLLEEMHARRMRIAVTGEVERVRANFVHGFRKLGVTMSRF